MKTPFAVAVALLALIFLLPAVYAQDLELAPAEPQVTFDRPVDVSIGGTTISIPAPDGFEALDQALPSVVTLVRAVVPPSNRMLAAFVPPDIAAQFAEGEVPPLNRYMMVQVARKFEDRAITPRDFAEVRAQLPKITAQKAEEITEKMNQYLKQVTAGPDGESPMSLSKSVPLGTLLDRRNAVSIAMAMHIRADGDATETVVVAAMSLVHVKEKVVFLYVYSKYKDDRTLDWVRKTSLRWINAVADAN